MDFLFCITASFLGIKIFPGQDVQIDIIMEQRIVTDSFLELPLEIRQCRNHDEVLDEDSIFKIYTQKGCQYECSLRHAQNECGCTAWNHPRPDQNHNNATCYGTSEKCFRQMMDDLSAQKVSS